MLRSCKAVKTDEYNKNSEMATSSQETLQYKGIEVQTYILHHKGTQEIFNIYYCLQMKLWEGNVFRGVCLSTGGVSVCPGGSLSREGVSVQGGSLYPGRWSLSRRPPYGCVWAVCILLECILLPIRFKYYTLKFTLMHELSHFGLETLIRLRLYA